MSTSATGIEDCTFEELGHTAEVGLRIQARSPAALFACAGRAMFVLIGAQVDDTAWAIQRQISLASLDLESLLVDWLSELNYLHETTGEVYLEYQIEQWTPTHLTATVTGRRPSQPLLLAIKAVTYHELQVTQEDHGWLAQVYFDI